MIYIDWARFYWTIGEVIGVFCLAWAFLYRFFTLRYRERMHPKALRDMWRDETYHLAGYDATPNRYVRKP